MENLVAVYASRAAAERVRDNLVECGVAQADIALSPDTQLMPAPAEHETNHSWWDWLFGSDVPDRDRTTYRDTLGRERTAVSVHLRDGAEQRTTVENLMHDAGALEFSGSEESLGGEASTTGAATGLSSVEQPVERRAAPPAASPVQESVVERGPQATPVAAGEAGETHIPLAREELVVGKQQTERRVHVRVYPVTRPVEESVRLRDERVVIERRPVRGDAMSGNAGAPDLSAPRDVEIVERHEEPVASKRKTATEEVVVRKDVDERTETVRDTVTETKADVDQPDAERK